MSFNLAAKVNNIEGVTSFLMNNLSDLATTATVTTTLSNYYSSTTCDATFARRSNPVFTGTVSGITSAMVGLGNANNTSDADKPVSTATQTALNTKQNTLIQNPDATGIPVIDPLNNVRRIFGDFPTQVNLFFDPEAPDNPKMNQIQLSFDSSISTLTEYYDKTTSDNKYQSKVAVSLPLSISANNTISIDLANYATLAYVATAIANYYTKTQSDTNYQAKITNTTVIQSGSTTISGLLAVNSNNDAFIPVIVRNMAGQ